MKTLFQKLFLLVVVVGALQLLLVPKMQKRKDLRRFEAAVESDPSILMFCDSTDGWIDEGDTDTRSISMMLADRLQAEVATISRGGYHAQIYAEFFDLLIRRGHRPQVVVVPINLRSLSPEWDQKPAYQFEQAKSDLRHADQPLRRAIDPLLRTLHLSDEEAVTQHDYKSTPVFLGPRKVGAVRDFDNPSYGEPNRERTRQKMIFHYLYPLKEDHRKLRALRTIAAQAREAGQTVLFYVEPIDGESGEALLPDEFRSQVQSNLDVLQRSLEGHEPPLVDLTFDLGKEAFSWHDYPNEHLNQKGRRHVAEALAQALESSASLAAQRTKKVKTLEASTNKR